MKFLLCFKPRLTRLARDQRGITALTFAFVALALLSIVGLATEAGLWLMTRQNAQMGADAAAVAASLALNEGKDPAAAANGSFNLNKWASDPSVTTEIHIPPLAVSPLANPALQAETRVFKQITPVLGGLVLGGDPFNIGVRSVAGMVPIGWACVLSTSADLLINAPQGGTVLLSSCTYGSNATDAGAITVNGANGPVNVYAFVTAGDCQNCPASSLIFSRPVSAYQPPVIDPFAAPVQTAMQGALPTAGNRQCVPAGPTGFLVPATGIPGNAAFPPTPPAGPFWTYCDADVVIASGMNLSLRPGVYLFYNASLTVLNGGTVACISGALPCDLKGDMSGTGVSFVFTGDANADAAAGGGPDCAGSALYPANFVTVARPGLSGPGLKICPAGNVLLSPPAVADVPASLAPLAQNGVLAWRDGRLAPGSAASPVADIRAANPYGASGGAPTYTMLNGLLYFPGAFVNYGANNAVNGGVPQVACTTLVAGGINLVNHMSIFLNCADHGLPTPRVLAVRVLR